MAKIMKRTGAKLRYYLKNKEAILANAKKLREEIRNDPIKKHAWHMYQRDRMLNQRYGIGHQEYEKMYQKQNGLCAICKKPKKGVRKRYLDVDHDHKTGEVRGLLCGACNKNLAIFESDWWGLASIYVSKLERAPL